MAESGNGLAEAMPDTSYDGSSTPPESEAPHGFVRTSSEGEDDKIVIARSGHRIDTSGTRWRVGVDHMINVEPFAYHPVIFDGATEFLRQQIRSSSAAYVEAQRNHLNHLKNQLVRQAVEASLSAHGHLDRSVFAAFQKSVGRTVSVANVANYSAAYVRWYLFNVDVGMPGFDDDVAAELDALVIGGNPQGMAVLSHDPNAGPIRPDEMNIFLEKLRDATAAGSLPVAHLALTWLLVCFGMNSKSVRLLHEGDFVLTDIPGGEPVWEIRIPRIKKRTSGERDQFRTRELPGVIGDLVDQLVADNRVSALNRGGIERDRFDWPLFRKPAVRANLLGTDMEREAFRVESSWPGRVLSEVAEALDLRTRSGERLHLTPRRLRYTYGTRLVGEGVSPQELADALDHSSIEHVMIYFNARLDAIKRIDETIGPGLAPIADAFLGRVAADEEQATATAGRRLPRISHASPTMQTMCVVGSCDEEGDCTLSAPIACYRCRDFIPWAEADHRAVLRDLLDRRDRKAAEGADMKWTKIHDDVAEAVKETIRRCDALLGKE